MCPQSCLQVALALSLSLSSGCLGEGDQSPTEAPTGVSKQGMLRDMGTQVILPTYEAFLVEAKALSAATLALAQAPGGDTSLGTAQGAFISAMGIWQQAEVMQVGPAGSASTYTGGLNLRDTIYSWPTVSSCRVDQEIVAGRYGEAGYLETSLVNISGLDALEYLLFNQATENTCPPQVTINSDGSWDALSPEELTERRAAYAHAVALYVQAQAQALVDAWHPDKGNFLGAFSSAGDATSPYPSTQDALNEVYASLFYLELSVKDQKLAEPAGLASTCAEITCPDALESIWAQRSKENVANNLIGFEALFKGGEGQGFEDLLQEIGSPELGTTMIEDITSAEAQIAGVEESFEVLLTRQEPEAVIAVHDRVKLVTDPMKGQLVTLLNLTVPNEGAGDND